MRRTPNFHGDLPVHKVGRKTGQPVEVVIGVPLLDCDVATLDKPFIAQPLAQGRDESCERCRRRATQKPDHRHHCARAASGHAVAPPSSVMNLRRFN
jgi:hypothetical protein